MTGPLKQGWVKCPTGEFERLQQRWWYQRIRYFAITAVAAVTASGAVALAAWEVGHVVIPNVFSASQTSVNRGLRQLPPCTEDAPPHKATD